MLKVDLCLYIDPGSANGLILYIVGVAHRKPRGKEAMIVL